MKKNIFTISVLGLFAIATSFSIVRAASFFVTNLPTSFTNSAFTAPYKTGGTTTETFTIYAWIGEYGKPFSAWNRNSLPLTTISPSTPAESPFAVSFDYQALGLASGKIYGYTLADRTGESGALFYGTPNGGTTIRCFTITAGDSSCDGTPTTPPSTGAASVAAIQVTLAAAGQDGYRETFKITPTSSITAATAVSVKMFGSSGLTVQELPVTLPTGTGSTFPTSNDLPAGSYSAAVFQGSNRITPTVSFIITANSPSGNTGVVTVPAGNNYGGGLSIDFPGNLQLVTNNAATITGVVTAQLAMPVRLGVVFGPEGGPLGGEREVMNLSMTPGQVKNFTASFSGLTIGKTYWFAIVNHTTNTTSEPLQFTTTGGVAKGGAVTYTGGLFPYTPTANSTGTSGDIAAYPDTISDHGIVPKCGRIAGPDVPAEQTKMCTYQDFLQLIANILQYAIILIGIAAAIAVLYVGFMVVWLSWNGDPTAVIMAKRREYIAIMGRIAVGVFIILIAWTIVATILRELGVKPAYILLDLVS